MRREGCRLLLAVVAAVLATAALAGETVNYTYDALGRLTGTATTGAVNDGTVTGITYDAAGNRLNYVMSGAGGMFSISGSAANEGSNLLFTITRSGSTAAGAGVSYATADGTAQAADYTSASGTLAFAPGEATKTVSVAALEDNLAEPAETVLMTLSAPTGAVILNPGATQATGTINASVVTNPPPVFSISGGGSVNEGGILPFVVTRTNPSSTGTYSVSYATSNGSAQSNDYTSASGTLTFGPGESTKTVNVQTTADSAGEPAETVLMNLSGPTNGATLGTGQAAGTIDASVETNPPPVFSISAGAPVNEGGILSFVVTRTNPSSTGSYSVSYATSNGSAQSDDYSPASGTLTFGQGESTKTVSVQTIADYAGEPAETVLMTLSGPTGGGTIGTAQAAGTINVSAEINPPPVFSITGSSVNEGGNLVFTVSRTNPSSTGNFGFNYASSDGTAQNSDYAPVAGALSFSQGETTKTITVTTYADSVSEPNETMVLTISGPTNGATIAGTGQATGTINNYVAPVPPPEFTINGPTADEGSSLVFTINRNNVDAVGSYSVSYATSNGTATQPSDYSPASGTVTFAQGEASKTVAITTVADLVAEPAETVFMNLSAPTNGATLHPLWSQGTGTINSSGAPAPLPVFSISGGTVAEAGNIVFTITRTHPSATGSFNVSYATSNGTAVQWSDYTPVSGTLTFGTGETSKNVAVAAIADGVDEPAETVLMTLSAPSNGATLDPQASQATGTIAAGAANYRPNTSAQDFFSIAQCTAGSFNVVANDTDSDGDYPLTLTGVSGAAVDMGYASVGSSTNVAWAKAGQAGLWILSYTVTDSRGAVATGSLRVNVTGSGSITCP